LKTIKKVIMNENYFVEQLIIDKMKNYCKKEMTYSISDPD